MGLDLFDRSEGFPAHCGSSRVPRGNDKSGDGSQGGDFRQLRIARKREPNAKFSLHETHYAISWPVEKDSRYRCVAWGLVVRRKTVRGRSSESWSSSQRL